MAFATSPSIKSSVPQTPLPAIAALWEHATSILSPPGTPCTEETQNTNLELSSQGSLDLSGVPASYRNKSSSSSTDPPPSQVAGHSQSSRILPPAESSASKSQTSRPNFIARDFAYEPKPPIIDRPVDLAWLVSLDLPKERAIPGLRERLGREWENANWHLYRGAGNRADLPGAIPKLWGGLPPIEDAEMMRKAKERIRDAERAQQAAAAFGLTPTEPNLGGPPPVPPLLEDADRNAMARADAYQQLQEAEALAAGHPPLIKTPTNSPPPEHLRRGLQPPPPRVTSHRSPPPPATLPRTPFPARSLPRPSKRTFEGLDSKAEHSLSKLRRRRQTWQVEGEDVENEDAGPSTSGQYALRPRPGDGTAHTSAHGPKSTKGKGKARTQ